MTRDEHVAEAERLLDSAKEVARNANGNKDQAAVMLNLLDFARLHAMIAAVKP